MSFGVIIVAAGRGDRMKTAIPKPLLEIGGETILRRSVRAFDTHPRTAELVVVLPVELVSGGPALVGPTTHPCQVVAGGAMRHDSVRRGFAAISDAVEVVLVHDAVRPFADHPLIDRVLDGVAAAGAAVPALPARDTLKQVDAATGTVAATLPRESIWMAQTPQGFRRALLAEVVSAPGAADATDEAAIAERLGHAVRIVSGDERNVKITTPGDLDSVRARLDPPRVGTGYDLHRLEAGRPFVLAGVTLPFDRGPAGHSDGDVVCHALIDAVLGGAGLGDIGQYFPNSDAVWKDAAGLDLLARSLAILGEHGFRVASADVTVVLQAPRVSPHVAAIRERLAGVLHLPIDRISVKGKTNEGVDAVGRGEAVAAHAVAVVVRGAVR